MMWSSDILTRVFRLRITGSAVDEDGSEQAKYGTGFTIRFVCLCSVRSRVHTLGGSEFGARRAPTRGGSEGLQCGAGGLRVRVGASTETWNDEYEAAADTWLVRRSRHPPRVGGPAQDHRGQGLDGADPIGAATAASSSL